MADMTIHQRQPQKGRKVNVSVWMTPAQAKCLSIIAHLENRTRASLVEELIMSGLDRRDAV